MSVTRIDLDDEALERAMALSRARTKKETANIALRFYAEQQERAARIGRHFAHALQVAAHHGLTVLHDDLDHHTVAGTPRTSASTASRTWRETPVRGRRGSRTGGEPVSPRQEQYCASLPIDRYMQSAFSISCSTASRLREVSRSMTSSGG